MGKKAEYFWLWTILTASTMVSAFRRKNFWVHKNWKTDKKILVFAQRQDYDSLAGINFDENLNEFNEIYLIQGWTPEGFEIIETYKTFWEWFKSVIDDIQEWVELE